MFKEEGRRKNINLALVSANNHYAGFAPGTANLFRKMVDLPEAAWGKGRIRRMRMKAKSDLYSSGSSDVRQDHSMERTRSDFAP
jgi:hypothetical protein